MEKAAKGEHIHTRLLLLGYIYKFERRNRGYNLVQVDKKGMA